ncbi:MAG: NADP-dependent malic enzyme, partial [Alphaproteobacteria bacterium]|nr:NADP-dependent malic enzyme [Alphaproteobacteria bacterium]
PIVIGRRAVVLNKIERLGLRIDLERDVRLVDPESDPAYPEYWRHYHRLMQRKGTEPDQARYVLRTDTTVIAAMMVKRRDADAMICGTYGQFDRHLRRLRDIVKLCEKVRTPAAMQLLIMPRHSLFLVDTHVTGEPDAEEIAAITLMAADQIRTFGIEPKVALVSHSNFGSSQRPSAAKMRQALRILVERAPELEVEGEMKADTALSGANRDRAFPNSRLQGSANLLVMPNLDAGNIAFNLAKVVTDGLSVGPIMLGLDAPAHVVTPSITVRGLVNMTAVAVVQAQRHQAGQGSGGAVRR